LLPIGILISNKSPVNPEQEIEEENIGRNEMYISHPSKKITVGCFLVTHDGRRISDPEACNNKSYDSSGIQPVIDPYGQLPYVYPAKPVNA
jgi:hypothetical protein